MDTTNRPVLGDVILMGTSEKKFRALFLRDKRIDPKTLPANIMAWYVYKPDFELDIIGLVSAKELDGEFTGMLLTPVVPVPEDGILANFDIFYLLDYIKDFEKDLASGKKENNESNREHLKEMKLIAKARGYLELDPKEIKRFEYDGNTITIENFAASI